MRKPLEVGDWVNAPKLVISNHNIEGFPVEVVRAGKPHVADGRTVQHLVVRDVRGRRCNCTQRLSAGSARLGRKATPKQVALARQERFRRKVKAAMASIVEAAEADVDVFAPSEVCPVLESVAEAVRALLRVEASC